MRLNIAILLIIFASLGTYGQDAKQVDVFGRITCDDYLARIQNTFNVAKDNPIADVYVIVYDGIVIDHVGKGGAKKVIYPTRNSIEAKIHSIKRLMVLWKVPADNIKILNGGYREEPMVEVWQVPNGLEPPKPSLTKKTMRFRKGKSRGFCTDCCG